MTNTGQQTHMAEHHNQPCKSKAPNQSGENDDETARSPRESNSETGM